MRLSIALNFPRFLFLEVVGNTLDCDIVTTRGRAREPERRVKRLCYGALLGRWSDARATHLERRAEQLPQWCSARQEGRCTSWQAEQCAGQVAGVTGGATRTMASCPTRRAENIKEREEEGKKDINKVT